MVTESLALVGEGNTKAACDHAEQVKTIIVMKDNIFFILFACQIKLVSNIFETARTNPIDGQVHLTAVGSNH